MSVAKTIRTTLFVASAATALVSAAAGQQTRVRVVGTTSAAPDVLVVGRATVPLTPRPARIPFRAAAYDDAISAGILDGIESRIGVPYEFGATGPDAFDCSGFVWSVFARAGLGFERADARTYWETFPPVADDERFRFGTLVFFNGLGHVGIVADEKGFYHASTSKGVTYSLFAGYWEARIVGFRLAVPGVRSSARAAR